MLPQALFFVLPIPTPNKGDRRPPTHPSPLMNALSLTTFLMCFDFSRSPEDLAPTGPSVEMVSLIRIVGVSEGSGMARGEEDQMESSDEHGTEVVLNSAILNKTPCPFLELLAFNH